MPSQIDPTHLKIGVPVSKDAERANWEAAKAELDHGGFAEGQAPANYAAATSRVSDHLAGIDAALGATGNTSAFTALVDTPTSYEGQANRYTRVRSDETGLEFVDQAASGDASITNYTQAGTGAVTRTVQSRLRDIVNVKDFGALGDGVTDDTNAFIAARQHAEASTQAAQVDDGNRDVRGRVAIYVPAGSYLITQKGAMLSNTFTGGAVVGITWVGAGNPLTEIIFRPAALDGRTPDTPFISNARWLALRCKGMTFTCDTPGAWFMHSDRPAAASVQNYLFEDVTWGGAWGGGFYLTGVNNNSEYRFIGCGMHHFDSGPFLWAVDSDQFLNYWFFGCVYWSSNAPMIRMTKGGHVNIFGLDASDWATDLNTLSLSEAFLFELLGFSHARGVCHFNARHVRVEAKHAQGKLIKSQWPQGVVSFEAVDYSSQAGSHTYGDIIDLDFQNVDGASYAFHDCELAGTVMLRAGSEGYRKHKCQVVFDNCRWWFKDKPSDIVNYIVPANSGGRPIARFRNCMPNGHSHASGHLAVWDADIGGRQAAVAQSEEKTLLVRGANTTVTANFSQRLKFPIGAIITKFSAYGKPGASSESTMATYSLKSTEGSMPTTIAQVAAANPSTARAYTEMPTNLPWFCEDAATADLDIAAEADVSNNHGDLVFVIRYL